MSDKTIDNISRVIYYRVIKERDDFYEMGRFKARY